MTIASRTPEGSPERCPICGQPDMLERSDPTGEFVCPSCGHLFIRFRDRLANRGGQIEHLVLGSKLTELGLDSLDLVELIMELEEEGITIPDEVAANFRTIADAIQYFVEELRRQKEQS